MLLFMGCKSKNIVEKIELLLDKVKTPPRER